MFSKMKSWFSKLGSLIKTGIKKLVSYVKQVWERSTTRPPVDTEVVVMKPTKTTVAPEEVTVTVVVEAAEQVVLYVETVLVLIDQWIESPPSPPPDLV